MHIIHAHPFVLREGGETETYSLSLALSDSLSTSVSVFLTFPSLPPSLPPSLSVSVAVFLPARPPACLCLCRCLSVCLSQRKDWKTHKPGCRELALNRADYKQEKHAIAQGKRPSGSSDP
jgi:hypothetical protein